MNYSSVINQNIDKLREICQQFYVERLYAFGSAITDSYDPKNSDLDFIAELESAPPLVRGERIIALWEALEELFVSKVDLITSLPIKNPFLKANIDRTKQLVYERESE